MAMSLNIKNEETCRLAGEMARLTGETMTGAITVALRERLEREKRERSLEARVQELRAIAERCAKLLGPGPSSVEHGDVLYDEWGLPSDR
jgi:antitoxin VapB